MLVLARKDIRSSNFTAQSGLKGSRVHTLTFINISLAFLVFCTQIYTGQTGKHAGNDVYPVATRRGTSGYTIFIYSITYTSLDITIVKTFNNLCETLKQSMWLMFCVFLQYAVSSHEKIVYFIIFCPCIEFTIASTYCENSLDTPNWSIASFRVLKAQQVHHPCKGTVQLDVSGLKQVHSIGRH